MFRTLLFTVVTALLTLPGVSIAALDMLEEAAELPVAGVQLPGSTAGRSRYHPAARSSASEFIDPS